MAAGRSRGRGRGCGATQEVNFLVVVDSLGLTRDYVSVLIVEGITMCLRNARCSGSPNGHKWLLLRLLLLVPLRVHRLGRVGVDSSESSPDQRVS